MKKIAVMLFLSILVTAVNAGAMPIFSGGPSNAAQTDSHRHCEEAVNFASHEESKTAGKLSVNHYCCFTMAVLHNSVTFPIEAPSYIYQPNQSARLVSYIAESIYKPPKHHL